METVDIDAKALYRTMHCSHKGYMTQNQGMLCLPDWIGLIKNRDGSGLHHWDHEEGCDKDGVNHSQSPYIIEVGCGNGILCKYLSLFSNVMGVDITDSPARQQFQEGWQFYEEDVTKTGPCELPPFHDVNYVISFDVLEHIERERIPKVIQRMTRARQVLVKVACSGDPPLHMTVESPGWWLDMLEKHAPNHNWSIIRNYRRQDERGNDIFAPLFYGRKEK